MTNKMSALKVANPYAKALFDFALNLYKKDENKNPLVYFKFVYEIQSVLKLLIEVPEFEEFLQNPLHSKETKKEVLNKTLTTKVSSTTLNFLYLLVDKKRIGLFKLIGETFLEEVYDFLCIKFVEVWSSIELSPNQEKRLTKKLFEFMNLSTNEEKLQDPIIFLTSKIEKKILGGLIIKIDSQLIDLSLRRDLHQLKIST